MGGYNRIYHCQKEIPRIRSAQRLIQFERFEKIIPAFIIHTEYDDQRRRRYKWLIVTGHGKLFFLFAVCNLYGSPERHIAGGRSLNGSVEYRADVFFGYRFVFKNTHAFSAVQQFNSRIHFLFLLLYFDIITTFILYQPNGKIKFFV